MEIIKIATAGSVDDVLIEAFVLVEVVQLFSGGVFQFANDPVKTFLDDLSVLVTGEDVNREGFGKNSAAPGFVIFSVGRKNKGLRRNSIGLG